MVDMAQIDSLITRCDEETLQRIVGADTIRLLARLDESLTRPSRLRELALSRSSRDELLRDASIRSEIFGVLKQVEAEDLARRLGLAQSGGDVWAALLEEGFGKGSRKERILYDWMGVDPPTLDEVNQAVFTSECSAKQALFSHQRSAARECLHFLTDGHPKRVMLHMPTGSGKTRTAMHVVCDFLRRREPGVVVWLAYSEELCSQASEQFRASWSYLGNRAVDVHEYWGDTPGDLDLVRDGVLVASLSKLYSLVVRGEFGAFLALADRTVLVVFDEAHQAIAPTYKLLLETILDREPERNRPLLGLSATPGRSYDDLEQDEALSSFFGGQKVTLSVDGWSNPLEYLIHEGYLASPKFRELAFPSSEFLGEQELDELSDSLDIPIAVLKRLSHIEQRNLMIINEAELMSVRHRRMLLFAATVDHAELLASVLSQRGVTSHAVTSRTPTEVRSRILKEYRSSNTPPMILTNFGVLTTGFDAPTTSAALIARPTKSLVLYSQMVGRAIRGPLVGGNASAEIATVVDIGLPGFRSVGEAFLNWEDVW